MNTCIDPAHLWRRQLKRHSRAAITSKPFISFGWFWSQMPYCVFPGLEGPAQYRDISLLKISNIGSQSRVTPTACCSSLIPCSQKLFSCLLPRLHPFACDQSLSAPSCACSPPPKLLAFRAHRVTPKLLAPHALPDVWCSFVLLHQIPDTLEAIRVA